MSEVREHGMLEQRNDRKPMALKMITFLYYFTISRSEYTRNPQIFYLKRDRILTQGDHVPNTLLSNIPVEVFVSRNLMHTLFVGKTSCHVDIFHWSL